MWEQWPYYVPAYPRSPITGRFKSTMYSVPDAHLDDWTAGHMLTCGKITINFPDWHYHGGPLTACDTICHPVTPPLSDGEGYPTGNPVMYPILHVSGLALSQSRIHTWVDSCLIMFRHIPIHPLPNAHLDDWTAEHMLACGKIMIIFPDWHYHGGLLTVCDTVCHPVTPL